MSETKTKRPSRKKTPSAGHSPMPHGGSTCGHSGCGSSCNVRYAGPTSHPRDHKIHQAAHGAGQVWMAAIVAGLAVVLTGSMAFAAAQADTAPKVKTLSDAVTILSKKLDNIQRLLQEIHAQLPPAQKGSGTPQGGSVPSASSASPTTGDTAHATPSKLTDEQRACVSSCETTWKSCQQQAADATAKEACTKQAYQCAQACVPSAAANQGNQ